MDTLIQLGTDNFGLGSLTKSGGHAGERGDVLHDHTSGGKHAHTAVLELRLAKPPHVDEVADAERVEADVTSLSSK